MKGTTTLALICLLAAAACTPEQMHDSEELIHVGFLKADGTI